MVLGIGATLGIEAFVWLTDMAGLSREEAAEVMRTNARCCVLRLSDYSLSRKG